MLQCASSAYLLLSKVLLSCTVEFCACLHTGYTIEVEIHDGPYNYIHNWDYVGVVQAIDNKQGHALCLRVQSCCC